MSVNFAFESAKAQSRVDDEVRLARLAISAFECYSLANDHKKAESLFDIGSVQGESF